MKPGTNRPTVLRNIIHAKRQYKTRNDHVDFSLLEAGRHLLIANATAEVALWVSLSPSAATKQSPFSTTQLIAVEELEGLHLLNRRWVNQAPQGGEFWESS